MTHDELLTDHWEACALGRPITHEEHVRIAWILLRRHGREEAMKRLVEGTRANCEALKVPERFDEGLTRRWGTYIADAIDADDAETIEALMRLLWRSDLLGLPAWRMKRS
jgi:hypothetical protein